MTTMIAAKRIGQLPKSSRIRRNFLGLILCCGGAGQSYFSSFTGRATAAAGGTGGTGLGAGSGAGSGSVVVHGLNLAVITGTTRTSGPPRPILGPRVELYITNLLKERGNDVTGVIHPNDFDLLQKPHFGYAKSQVPESLQKVYDILNAADGYVCITPEYNHAPSPGLINVLNHFGSSIFSFKPSAIVSYSAGQWGGTRAAVALRPILSELGCLPVSAMIHIPKVQDVLNENGTFIVDNNNNKNSNDDNNDNINNSKNDEWDRYCGRCFSQLEWWGTAAKEHRLRVNPFDESPSFQTNPNQRNAP